MPPESLQMVMPMPSFKIAVGTFAALALAAITLLLRSSLRRALLFGLHRGAHNWLGVPVPVLVVVLVHSGGDLWIMEVCGGLRGDMWEFRAGWCLVGVYEMEGARCEVRGRRWKGRVVREVRGRRCEAGRGKAVKDLGGVWRVVEGWGKLWTRVEGCAELRRGVEGCGLL